MGKCNYSDKFLPLVVSWGTAPGVDLATLEAKLNNFFTNANDAKEAFEEFLVSTRRRQGRRSNNFRISEELNTKKDTKSASKINIASAYLGRSDAYFGMVNKFGRTILELSRIKFDYDNRKIISIDANELNEYGVSTLNQGILNYKLKLIENILASTPDTDSQSLFASFKNDIIKEFLKEQDFNELNKRLNYWIDYVLKQQEVKSEVWDDYVKLKNFDALIEQCCDYIKIDSRYKDSDAINKYEYVGANVEHFTGWSSGEFADAMDQSSALARTILDYLPVVNEHGAIEGSSIGFAGFLSSMTKLKESILYDTSEELLPFREILLNLDSIDPTKVEEARKKLDMTKLIDAYINRVQKITKDYSLDRYYKTDVSYAINKLKGIRDFIFNEKSGLDKELRDIFFGMFIKNVQLSYEAYEYNSLDNILEGRDLRASVINTQAYHLGKTISSAIYYYRTNPDAWDSIIGTLDAAKYQLSIKGNLYKIISKRTGSHFQFDMDSPIKTDTNFGFEDWRTLFLDIFGYRIPSEYIDIGKAIRGENWDYTTELSSLFKLTVKAALQHDSYGGKKFEFENGHLLTNLNSSWNSEFSTIGEIMSVVYGSDTKNVVKNITGKNNLPLYGLTSLSYNFPFIMTEHIRNEERGSIYMNSFLADKYDQDGHIVESSIVGSPLVRSEVLHNGETKSVAKLTVAEVARLSILSDFYQNFLKGKTIYLQNATFADKGTHFLVKYNLKKKISGTRNLQELIEQQLLIADGTYDKLSRRNSSTFTSEEQRQWELLENRKEVNGSGLFDLMFNTRRDRMIALKANILEDYSKVFGQTFDTVTAFQNYVAENQLSYKDINDAFHASGITFNDEVHGVQKKGGSWGFNEVVEDYFKTFTNRAAFEKRINSARVAFAKDLVDNRVKFLTSNDPAARMLAEKYQDWITKSGKIVLAKTLDGKEVDYTTDFNGLENVKLHPVLEAYLMSNDLLSNEYNELMIGGVYCHPKTGESGRLIAQIKRSVIFGATMHPFIQNLDNGVASEVKIACMPDIGAAVHNLLGTSKEVDSMDGSGLSTPLQARLESNSLLDARSGYDKKTIGHDNDARYGKPTLLKWAVYAITNARRRIAFESRISQERLLRKMYSAGTIDLNTEEFNKMLKKIGPVYFYDVENTGNYYEIKSFEVTGNRIVRTLQQVNENGKPIGQIFTDSIEQTNQLWDIDQMFGGAWAMGKNEDGLLDYSEANVDALEYYVTTHKDAKTKQIGYAVNKSAIKVGSGNMNSEESWYNDSALRFITMKTKYTGVQMDAEHHLNENEVTEMTQMISAITENGYSSEIVDRIYAEIGQVIVQELTKYNEAINSPDQIAVYKLLGETFIKSFEENDRDTIGLAQAYVIKASKALKENNLDFKIPFSAETISGIFVSTISSALTKAGIRRKYEGFAGVLTPSFNMMQYYQVGGRTMMYEQFASEVRKRGIVPQPYAIYDGIRVTDLELLSDSELQDRIQTRSAVKRAIYDVWIDGQLNPFLEETTWDKIDFEDTAVIFSLNEFGEIDRDSKEEVYISSRKDYINFRNRDFTNKVVYKFTSRPHNLKGTDVKFTDENGVQYSVHDLDSVKELERLNDPEYVKSLASVAQMNKTVDNLLDALSRRKITVNGVNYKVVSKFNGKYYIAKNRYAEQELLDWIGRNNLTNVISIKSNAYSPRTASTKWIEINENYAVDYLEESQNIRDLFEDSEEAEKVRDILLFLKERTGINYQVISADAAKFILNTNNVNGINAFNKNGISYFIKGKKLSASIVAEEMLHPLVNALKANNPTVFNYMLQDAQAKYPKLKTEITFAYANADIDTELVTQALAREFVEVRRKSKIFGYEAPKFLGEFIDWVKTMFNMDDLPVDRITLEDLANVINSDIELDYAIKLNLNLNVSEELQQRFDLSGYKKKLEETVQFELRTLRKISEGKPLQPNESITVNGKTFIPKTATFKAAQLITGRYHAKNFMIGANENVSDVLEQKEQFFINKLSKKYELNNWISPIESLEADRVYFSKNGEKYLIKQFKSEEDKYTYANTLELTRDKDVEKIGNSYYLGEEKITSLNGVDFYKYTDEESGESYKIILIIGNSMDKLFNSNFFEFFRRLDLMNEEDVKTEKADFKRRIKNRASRMFESFEHQLKMLGTRIPTQAMQSFMPMEIVGYTDSDVNDVYVPPQQTFLQGSKRNWIQKLRELLETLEGIETTCKILYYKTISSRASIRRKVQRPSKT